MADKINPLDSRDGLLDELAVLDLEGWGGERGERLLSYVRAHIVHPQVFAAGLRGPAAAQAEATGWEVAWEALNSPRIRIAESPWGWLWVAVRRAVLGELMGSTYLTSDRNSWRVRRACSASPVSLTQLLERGWDQAEEPAVGPQLGSQLDAVVAALVQAGWERAAAHAVVEGIAVTAVRDGKSSTEARGWRPLAIQLGLPPWQVRRVMVVLLGAPGWPGVIERMADEGDHVVEEAGMWAALRSTLVSSSPTPALAAQKASWERDRQLILAAS
jgi:hypothetical protein